MRRLVVFSAAFMIAFLAAFSLLAINRPAVGTEMVQLSMCELEIFDPPLQPRATLVLACPGRDYIRLWPLPVQKPWFEKLPPFPASET